MISKNSSSLKHKLYAVANVTENSGDNTITRRQGTVVSFEPLTQNCTITLGGSTDTISEVAFISSYFPVVGDTVWVDIKGGDMLIIGITNVAVWVPYTPAQTNFGASTLVAKYHRVGQTCDVAFSAIMAGNPAGDVNFAPPFPRNTDTYGVAGSALGFIGTSVFDGSSYLVGTRIVPILDSLRVGTSAPFVWGSGDKLIVSLRYEVASDS